MDPHRPSGPTPIAGAADNLKHLKRRRLMARATLLLGLLVSIWANVLHAQPNLAAQVFAAWPPVALLTTIELITRVPVRRRRQGAVRLLATAAVAGIAAWVSYGHIASVAAKYGETGGAPYLIPLSIDGLVIVASICLVELTGRIAELQAVPAETIRSATAAESPSAQSAIAGQVVSNVPMSRPAVEPPPVAPTDRPVEEVARQVAAELRQAGQRVTRDALAAGVRALGVRIATDRAASLARELVDAA